MKFFILFLSLFTLFILPAHAVELDTNYVTFTLSKRDVELQHSETSSETNFTSLSDVVNVPTFSLVLGLEKEFFETLPISITPMVGYGFMFGKTKDELTTKNLKYDEKVSGSIMTLGGTVNVNLEVYKMRTQFFGGLKFVRTETDYKLKYTPISSSTPQINFDYSDEGTQSFLTTGLRFFNPKVGLFSIFALEYAATSSFTNQATDASKIDSIRVQAASPALIDHSPLVLSLGFGMMF